MPRGEAREDIEMLAVALGWEVNWRRGQPECGSRMLLEGGRVLVRAPRESSWAVSVSRACRRMVAGLCSPGNKIGS